MKKHAAAFIGSFLLLLTSAVSVATPTERIGHLYAKRSGIRPSQDDFYDTPTNIADYQPGDIIRQRQVPNNITSLLPGIPGNISATYQIFFRTTNAIGGPAGAVTTLWVPSSYHPKPNNLLSYMLPTDSANPDCAPSFNLQNGFSFTADQQDVLPTNLLPIAALNLGWYVNLPDFEGLEGAYQSGMTAGHIALDSMRAVLKTSSVSGVAPDAKCAMWGYSGGALPVEFASEIQSQYAPELNIVGGAFGGFNPVRGTGLVLGNLPNPFIGLLIGTILGLSHAYPNLSTYLDEHLAPSQEFRFRQGERTCSISGNFSLADLIPTYFKNPLTALENPIVTTVFKWGTRMGLRGVPSFPLYVDIAMNLDTPLYLPDGYYTDMCKKGTIITYMRNRKTNHASEAIVAAAGSLYFLQDRFNGVPGPTNCTRTTITTNSMDPSQVDLYGDIVYAKLVDVLANLGGVRAD